MSAFNGFDLIIYLFGLVSILLSLGLVAFFLISNAIEKVIKFKDRLYGHAKRFDGDNLDNGDYKKMKIILLVIALCTSQYAKAEETSTLSQVTTLAANTAKSAKHCAILSFNAKPGACEYLPIWTWKSLDGTELAEFPAVGYRAIQGQKPAPFLTATANLPGLSHRFFGSEWFKAHVTKLEVPPFFFGPALLIPLNYGIISRAQWKDWKDYSGVIFSIKI